jgi:hypothetical protein
MVVVLTAKRRRDHAIASQRRRSAARWHWRTAFAPASIALPMRVMTALTATPIGWTGTGAAPGFVHKL